MSLENVPNVNSEEFAEFLRKNGLDERDLIADVIGDSEKKEYIHLKERFSAANIIEKIDQWSMNNPGASLIIFFGGSGFICYKILQMFIAGAIFKANLKTLKYISKISR